MKLRTESMANEQIPVRPVEKILEKCWRGRLLVLGCGLLGAAAVFLLRFAAPRYQAEVEVRPPSWTALATFNSFELAEFQRAELYDRFLRGAVSHSIAKKAWIEVNEARGIDPNVAGDAPTGQIVGPSAKEAFLAVPYRMVFTGPDADVVRDFMVACIESSRERVLRDARNQLQAADQLRMAQIDTQLTFLEAGDRAALEAQRAEDRRAALAGSGDPVVPLAYLSEAELRSLADYYREREVPEDLEIAAMLDLGSIEGPRNWYRLVHAVAGLLAGLMVGAWLAVVWIEDRPRAQSPST